MNTSFANECEGGERCKGEQCDDEVVVRLGWEEAADCVLVRLADYVHVNQRGGGGGKGHLGEVQVVINVILDAAPAMRERR